jgi:hypothetical protein
MTKKIMKPRLKMMQNLIQIVSINPRKVRQKNKLIIAVYVGNHFQNRPI